MKEFRGGGMNDEYGMSGMAREYQDSGKMPKKLLRYFERKNKDKEYGMGGAYRDYQGGGAVDPSEYRLFKEEGQPIQYFVRGEEGFEPAGGGADLRRRLGDEGYANVLSRFGIQPELSAQGELLGITASPEAYGAATDEFARELAGFRREEDSRGVVKSKYDEDFLNFLAEDQAGSVSNLASMRGMSDIDDAMRRQLAQDLFEKEGLPGIGRPDKALAYRDYAKRVLGMGTGGAQGGR